MLAMISEAVQYHRVIIYCNPIYRVLGRMLRSKIQIYNQSTETDNLALNMSGWILDTKEKG